MPKPEQRRECGQPAKSGKPCRMVPFLGSRSGRCYRHAGLAITDAQRAAGGRSLKHGYYADGLLGEEERALYDQVLSDVRTLAEGRAHLLALSVVRAMRVADWETRTGQASPVSARARAEFRQALEAPWPWPVQARLKSARDGLAPPLRAMVERSTSPAGEGGADRGEARVVP